MCDCCRRLKQALWTARAQSETTTGLRNWFGTLTLSPAEQYQMVSRSRRRLSRGGTDFDSLSPEEQFSEVMTEIGSEVTLWIKRVRKESGAALRYLLVAEAHKSGAPHLHVLIHEGENGVPVRYRTLASQWKLGFVKFNLVEGSKAARYVCKYISKSAMARVRASLRYGQNTRVSEEWRETKWKESSPRERKEINVLTTEGENLLRNSLTDHTGGKFNHGIEHEGVWKQPLFPPRDQRGRVYPTRPDGQTDERLHEATPKGPDKGFHEAAVPAITGPPTPVAGPENPVQANAAVTGDSGKNRSSDSEEDDFRAPF